MRYLVLATIVLVFTSACSTTPGPESTATEAPATAADATPETTPEVEAETVAERAFPDESIYPLLVAEFALRRRHYDVALDNYLEQSEVLRDRGVSAHATRLAQFMHRDEAAIESSELWVELDPDNLEARLTLANLLAL
jgi:hypothetical protein